MNAVSHIRPRIKTLGELAQEAMAADDAWNAAYDAHDNEALAFADDALLEARRAFHGALIAETGISHEMFVRLGVVL